MKVVVYLSGPITARDGHTMKDNADYAATIWLTLVQRGITAFCPHLSCYTEHLRVSYEEWMVYDFNVLDLCTHILMLPRWDTSDGAQRELKYATERGLVVCYDMQDIINAHGQNV